MLGFPVCATVDRSDLDPKQRHSRLSARPPDDEDQYTRADAEAVLRFGCDQSERLAESRRPSLPARAPQFNRIMISPEADRPCPFQMRATEQCTSLSSQSTCISSLFARRIGKPAETACPCVCGNARLTEGSAAGCFTLARYTAATHQHNLPPHECVRRASSLSCTLLAPLTFLEGAGGTTTGGIISMMRPS